MADSSNGAAGHSPQGPFNLSQRLFRGYGPVAVFAAIVILTALAVPSKVPKASNASSVNANGATGNEAAGVVGGQAGPAGGAGPAAQTGAVASGGTAGTAGRTNSTAGTVVPCAGAQVPGDPYSPPCVTFSGNNGGATSKGVTGDTINVAVRLTNDQSFQQTLATLAGAQLRDTNDDNKRTILALAQYFNTHFQFYGRKIKINFFTGQGSLANELQGYGQPQALADATTAAGIPSFADISAESEPYGTALQQQKVMGFGDPYMPNFWHQNHAPYDWSIATDGTDVATVVANYAVQKLCPAGTKAAYGGGAQKNAPRKFAGIAPENELYQVSATVFKQIMEAHGCHVDTFKYTLDLSTESEQAANLISQLKAGGYTTILCGCDPIFPVFLSGQGPQQTYLPEFVEIGAALVDQDYVGQLYNQKFYAHAFGISPNAPTLPYTQTIGYAAYKTINHDEPAFFVNIIYLQMDMLAIGLQMAGPNLTPANYQKGMFAYPPRQGPAGLWGWSPTQYTIPNDVREVCWSPNTVSPYNGKMGAYIGTSNQRWTVSGIPAGPPGCPIPPS
jgi:hypothetical protein